VSLAGHRLAAFAGALRRAGVAVDSGRAIDFLTAIDRLPPADATALRRLARLVFVRRIEDGPAFEAAFDAWFLDRAPIVRDPDAEEERTDDSRAEASDRPPEVADGEGGGKDASADERLDRRPLAADRRERAALAHLAAAARAGMPLLASRRRRPSRRGDAIDLARTAAAARRTFGVPIELVHARRPPKWRRLLVLIDVSGSLKAHSETFLKAAHALLHAGPPAEAFSFGTRLTRLSPALGRRDAGEALAELADLVRDIDGGTRIGPALAALLAEPRHQARIRGAVTVIVSDGLERGDPEPMRRAVERLARTSYRLVWLSPLAARPDYVPATRAMRLATPAIDLLEDSSSLAAFARAFAALPALDRAPRGRAFRISDLDGRAA